MYSCDFRIAALKMYQNLKSYHKVSRLLQIGVGTIWRWTHGFFRKLKTKKDKITNLMNECIRNTIVTNPYISCHEMVIILEKKFRIHCSRQLISKKIKKLGFSKVRTRTKIVVKESYERIKFFIQSFRKKEKIISIDESAFYSNAYPLYGYCKKGERLVFKNEKPGYKRWSLLMAISNTGHKYWKIYDTSVNGLRFHDFLVTLPNRFTYVLDNASIHKTKKVKELFSNKQSHALYTPPYCPQCNPVEIIFSKLKFLFRKADIRNDLSIVRCIEQIDSDFVIKCFQHVQKTI